jgi:hypothetical protein
MPAAFLHLGAPTRLPSGYVVRDANGQALVHVCSRYNEAEALHAKVLTKDEAPGLPSTGKADGDA